MIANIIGKFKQYQFVFEELVKRDFKRKYKRNILGVLWSMLAPLFTLLVMNFVFGHIFGRTMPHYIIYLFSGNLLFNYFTEATNGGMMSLMDNAHIFSKVKVPKYLFLFSRVVSSSINFLLTMIVYFIFVAFDGLAFTWKFILLLFPFGCLFITILGVGLILSALYVFFRDIQYLYGIFTTALMYFTPIFYDISLMGDKAWVFYCNPLFLYINYVRQIVIYGQIPSLAYHSACLVYAFALFGIGCLMYKKYNFKFLYYV